MASESDKPITKRSFISSILFCWILPFLRIGRKRKYVPSDIYRIPEIYFSKNCTDRLQKEWERELRKSNPSFGRAMSRAFRTPFLKCLFIRIFSCCFLTVARTAILGFIVTFLANQKQKQTFANSYETMLIFVGILIALIISNTTLDTYAGFYGNEVGIWARSAASNIVYEKTLRLNAACFDERDVPQLANVLSNDINRLETNIKYVHFIIIAPIQLVMVTLVLWPYLGACALTPSLFCLCLLPIQFIIGHAYQRIRFNASAQSDLRVEILKEIINGIKLIKMSALEVVFGQKIDALRQTELRYTRSKSYFDAWNRCIFDTASKTLVLLTLFVYVATGNTITEASVFTTLSLEQYIRFTITSYFPQGINGIFELSVSFSRIQRYLQLPEKQPCATIQQSMLTPINSVELTNLSVSFSQYGAAALCNVSLQLKPQQLKVVLGIVGAGKTSLLLGILNELYVLTGSAHVNGSIAYVPQDPYIFSGTILDNILFGKPYMAEWFRKVLSACDLEQDLTSFSSREFTCVGENGTTLSGGQKARVGLARAVYANADVYLLDDPLSAVDPKVCRHLMDTVIHGMLRSKAILLVTHQVYYIEPATEYILIEKGRVVQEGRLSELEFRAGSPFISETKSMTFDIDTVMGKETPPPTTLSINPFIKAPFSAKIAFERKIEQRVQGVSWKVHWRYFKAGATFFSGFLFIAISILGQILLTASDDWLKVWNHNQNLWKEENGSKTTYFLTIYAAMVVCLFFASLVSNFLLVHICMNSSWKISKKLFLGLLRAPMLFYEKNTTGRVMNRAVSDVGYMDETVPKAYQFLIPSLLQTAGSVVLMLLIDWVLVAPSILVIILYIIAHRFYAPPSCDIKRLSSATQSPVFAQATSTAAGLATIRAFGIQNFLIEQFRAKQDAYVGAYFLNLVAQKWFNAVTVWIVNIYASVVLIVLIFTTKDPATIGLGLSTTLSLTSFFPVCIFYIIELENQIIAAERIFEYCDIEPEGNLRSLDQIPPPCWGQDGKVEVEGLCVTYDSNTALHNASLSIFPNEKFGVVGRTGAGKTSLVSAIFRLVEPSSGRILIDNLDTKLFGLHDLRERITIIPQHPFLFSAKVRENLDPHMQHSDCTLIETLTKVGLSIDLDTQLTHGGTNLSSGQTQLLCLARAILTKTKILILDEATASIDARTDFLVQQVLRERFRDCTVITIAHKLDTVASSDRICILHSGTVKEIGVPLQLLQDQDSQFYSMAKQLGPKGFSYIQSLAKKQKHF